MSKSTVLLLFSDSWQNSCGYVREIAHQLTSKSKIIIFNPFIQHSIKDLLFDQQKRAEWLLPFGDKKVTYIPNIALLPFKRFKLIQRINAVVSFWLCKIWLVALKTNEINLLTWYFSYEMINHPYFLEYGRTHIYDRPDQIASINPIEDAYLKQLDRRLIAASSLVVVNSKISYDYVRSATKQVIEAPWGLDAQFSRPISKKNPSTMLATISYPRLGMVGAIDHRLDTKLIYELATAESKWQIVLVGGVFEFSPSQSRRVRFAAQLKKLLALPNIHHLSEIPHDQVAKLMRELDVGLVLYDAKQEFVKGSNPIKMYEYLASDLPVVSTDIPAARLLQPYVITARTTNSFVKAVHLQLKNQRSVVSRTSQSKSWNSKNHTWKAHVSTVLAALSDREK